MLIFKKGQIWEILQKKKNQKDYQKVLDKKTNYQGILKNIVTYIAILMAIFHLYTGNFGLLVALKQRSLHLLFGFVLIFFLYPTFKPKEEVTSKINIIDIVLIGLSVVCFGYMFIFESQIMLRPALPNAYDLIIGGVCILLVLEATRRVVGSALPILAVIFLLYAYYGQYFPGFFFHRGFSLKRIIDHIYVTTNGIFGIPIAVSASFVFLFILAKYDFPVYALSCKSCDYPVGNEWCDSTGVVTCTGNAYGAHSNCD